MATINPNDLEFANFRNMLKSFRLAGNGDVFFNATIVYMINGQAIAEVLKVRLCITSWEYGTVIIEDGEKLTPEICHLTFLTEYQEFSCTAEGFLYITGYSNDFGHYKVWILPA